MTPKAKAKELVDDFDNKIFDYLGDMSGIPSLAKQCALMVVDEARAQINSMHQGNHKTSELVYWLGVRKEINEL